MVSGYISPSNGLTPGSEAGLAAPFACDRFRPGTAAAISKVRPDTPVKIVVPQHINRVCRGINSLFTVLRRTDNQAGNMVQMGMTKKIAVDALAEDITLTCKNITKFKIQCKEIVKLESICYDGF